MILHVHPAAARREEEERRLDQALEAGVREIAAASLSEERRRRRHVRIAAGAVALAVVGGAIAWVLRPPPATPEQLVRNGWELWREGRSAEAEPIFQQAVGRAPRLAEAWSGLGWTRLAQGDRAGAREAFDTVLQLNPDHGAAQNGLGQLAAGRCDLAAAEMHWRKAARAPAAQMGLVRLYLAQRRWAEAERLAGPLQAHDFSRRFAQQALAAARNQSVPPEIASFAECSPAPGGRS